MLKATMSTAVIGVSLAQQSSPAAFSDGSDAGFSEILSGVHTTERAQQGAVGSVRKEDASYAETAETSVNPDAAKAEAPDGRPVSENARTGENADVSANTGETGEEKIAATFTDTEYRAVHAAYAYLEENLTELVVTLSNGDEDEEGKIIDALLKFLKERQEAENGDETISLAIELLAAMLGGAETRTQTAEITLTVKNASAEITEISGSYRAETALPENGGFSEGTALSAEDFSEEAALSESGGFFGETVNAPIGEPTARTETETETETETVPETAEARTEEPRTVETAQSAAEPIRQAEERPETAVPVQTDSEPRAAAAETELPARETPERTEIPVTRDTTAQEQPIREAEPKTAEQLLSDILDKARRELGLTKAELRTEPKAPEERTEVRLPQSESGAADESRPENGGENPRFSARELFLTPNHKDGRSELERILDGGKEEEPLFDPNAAIPRETARTAEIPRENEPKTEPIPIERQLTDELLSRTETVSGGRSEFTMVLNPESLGRITVRMISAGGRVQVSVAAENEATRQLLESRGDQIGTALKNSGVELERYQVVSGREEAQLMQDNYDGSSKNPYGREEEPAEEQPADDGEDFLEILQQL